jgi:hypothetical protein
MHRSVPVLVLLLLSSSAVARAQEGDAPDSHPCRAAACLGHDPFDPLPPPYTTSPGLDLGIDWEVIAAGASSVFFRFFGNIVPPPSGIQRANLHENPLTEMDARLGDTPFSFVVMGNGNNYWVRPDRFYREYNGVIGLRLGLLPPGRFQISLTAAPIAVTLANVTEYAGVEDGEPLPSALTWGGAGGIGATYHASPITLEVSAYAMPGLDVSTGAAGVRQVQLAMVSLSLNEAFELDDAYPMDVSLQLLHVDRGDALESVYAYAPENFRSPRELREVYQAMAWLALRRE